MGHPLSLVGQKRVTGYGGEKDSELPSSDHERTHSTFLKCLQHWGCTTARDTLNDWIISQPALPSTTGAHDSALALEVMSARHAKSLGKNRIPWGTINYGTKYITINHSEPLCVLAFAVGSVGSFSFPAFLCWHRLHPLHAGSCGAMRRPCGPMCCKTRYKNWCPCPRPVGQRAPRVADILQWRTNGLKLGS